MSLGIPHWRAARRAWIVLGLAPLLSGCQKAAPGLDLLALDPQKQEDAPAPLRSATVAGRDRAWVIDQTGKPIRIHDVVRRTLPASPPSRIEYEVDIPEGAHFTTACGIAEDRQDKPGVEFVVKIRQGDQERTLATQLVDPLGRPKHRRWLPLDIDLSKHTGRATLILETRGYEAGDADPRWAFWGAPTLTSPKRKAPLVIVYLVDTLRADHTTPYGYKRNTTPELARFAQDAVVFETAITTASWTKPSVGSIFTSQLPGRHRAVQLRDPLDPGHLTLAEMLKEKGYVTGAAIANSVIYSAGTHFEQGFDSYAGLHGAADRPSKIVEAASVIDTALQWLDTRGGLPGFLYVHTMDPHVPYTPPAPFDRMFEPHPAADRPATDPRTDYKEPIDRERMIAQYDGEIAYGDRELGRFLGELKARGLYEDALIVFVADHGEEFLDHGQWTHGKSVFDELIRVPLIVKFPGRRDAGRRIAQQVQTMDILPTILEAMALPSAPRELIAGHPLQQVIGGGAWEPRAVSEISHRGFVAYGMRTGENKYVRRFSPQEDELYFDLRGDPAEQTNRVTEAVDQSRKMRSDLDVAMAPSPYRHHLKFVGSGTYSLTLRCAGWINGLEAVNLGTTERAEPLPGTQTLRLEIRPRPGQPREIVFTVRPMGAPVWVQGTRDGRPLAVSDVLMAHEGIRPPQVPFKLPDVESENEREGAGAQIDMLAPPAAETPGLHLWLTLKPGLNIMNMDAETCEKLKALGYVSQC